MFRQAMLAGALALAAASGAIAAPDHWVGSWGASPEPPRLQGGGPFPASPSFKDVTLIQTVRLSAGGNQLRVRFTNEYGAKALVIGGAKVSVGGVEKPLLFGGKPTAIVPAGAPMVSDPVSISAPARSDLVIGLYLPEDTGPCTCHTTAVSKGAIADHQAASLKPSADAKPLPIRAFISGVDVSGPAPAKTIVAFGDSITDGVGSSMDANRRWPDQLSERLNARDKGKREWGVVNEGISGNRLYADGAGQSALTRFDRDVLSTPGAAYLIVFEGVNDLGVGHAKPPPGAASSFLAALPKAPANAEDLIAADRQIIERAHAHGIKVIGATIAPYKGAAYWTEEGEAERQKVNTWIRAGGAFDGVADFDKAWNDPANPGQIKAGWHIGDHLHGNDAGYKVLADSIDLKLFQ
jgi:lysophospholipase L1-like esterase